MKQNKPAFAVIDRGGRLVVHRRRVRLIAQVVGVLRDLSFAPGLVSIGAAAVIIFVAMFKSREGPVRMVIFEREGREVTYELATGTLFPLTVALLTAAAVYVTVWLLDWFLTTRVGHEWYGCGAPKHTVRAALNGARRESSPIVAAAVSDLGAAMVEWDRTQGSGAARVALYRSISQVEEATLEAVSRRKAVIADLVAADKAAAVVARRARAERAAKRAARFRTGGGDVS